MKQLTQYHWYHRRNPGNRQSHSDPTSFILQCCKWAGNSFCEWNGTRPFGPVAIHSTNKKFSNLSPEILVEWIAPNIFAHKNVAFYTKQEIASTSITWNWGKFGDLHTYIQISEMSWYWRIKPRLARTRPKLVCCEAWWLRSKKCEKNSYSLSKR